MEIKTLQVAEYKGCKIYIRNFNKVFEYIVVVGNEIYTTHIIATKRPLQALLRQDYTSKQLTDVVKYLMNTAEATIDFVTKKKK